MKSFRFVRFGFWAAGGAVLLTGVGLVRGMLAGAEEPALDPSAPVVDASLKDPNLPVPSGGWVTVRGRNLAPVSIAWTGKNLPGEQGPTELAGVSLTVNGQPALIAALRKASGGDAAADEIDAVLPPLPEGVAVVQVTTPQGVSQPVTVRVAAVQPSFFVQPAPDARHVRAGTPDGEETIGPPDLFGAAPATRPVRPAIPLETVVLHANGCGPLETPVSDGSRPGRRIPLQNPVTLKIGETEAAVRGAGASPTVPGLCEIEAEIPLLPSGEYELSGRVGEIPFASGRILAVREVEYPGFRHGEQSRFRLTGAHHFVTCTACHQRSRFWGTPQACEACHLDRYRAVRSPDHAQAGFPLDCSQCHVTSRFKGARGGHSAASGFPLTGKHAAAGCEACHAGGRFDKLETACVSCHLAAYETTAKPAHAAAGIGKQCSLCHTPAGWTGARLDHSQTRFALTGKHAKAPCSACHVEGAPKPQPQCLSCHRAQYESAANPNHIAAGYPGGCDACHTTEAFRPARTGHPQQRFPLTGKHEKLPCEQCHRGGLLNALSPACAGCHLDRYQAAANPNHVAAGFPVACEKCHTTAGFSGAAIKHDQFPLTGRHQQTACSGCHRNGVEQGAPRLCSACHLDRYNAAANPAHGPLGFPTECQLCHSTTQFAGAVFQHGKFYPLEGRHASAACGQCHAGGRYKGTPRECSGCHAAAYTAANSPNHASQGFPMSCQNCHTPAGWRPSSFTHSSYALTGKHTSASCAQCHGTGQSSGLSRDCYACHAKSYAAASAPNHALAGFPTNCQMCHTPAGWRPSSFTHSSYALTGKHAAASCAQCHPGGKFAGTSPLCSSCHLASYHAAQNPNHAGPGFPLACQLCHSVTAWSGASFGHGFPIFSGKHNHKWSKCADCHVQPANYKVFSCFGCHSKNKMDDEHKKVGNYSYDSLRCLQCHPEGGKK